MKFKVDENLPSEVCDQLCRAGHDAVTVAQQRLTGHPDAAIAVACRAEKRALISLDTDFGNALRYPPADYSGLIVLRIADQSKLAGLALLPGLLAALATEPVVQRLWIVEEQRIRVRGSPD